MVTVLEPMEMASPVPHQLEETSASRPARTYRMGYMVPCAGVRYYSFQDAETAPKVPAVLRVRLIDEKVILI